MSIKTYQIGTSWITFLVISIGLHLTLLAISFSPEALKLVTPKPHQKSGVSSQNPFYIDVITLPPDAIGRKIAPKELTRFANESRSVDAEGSPLPAPGKGRGNGLQQTPSAKSARSLDLFPRSGTPRTSPRGAASSRDLSGKNAGDDTGRSTAIKREKTQTKDKEGTKKGKTAHKRAMIKDGAIIIEGQHDTAKADTSGDDNGKGTSTQAQGLTTKAGLRGGSGNGEDIGPPSLFPSNESIARVARKNRGTGARGGGIYLNNRSRQLQVNATELKDARYLLDLKRKLDLYWDYPISAAKRGEQGTLKARFKVKRDGTIYNIKLVKSSGYPTLDDAVTNALRLCSPLNPLPDDYDKKELNVNARFKYILTMVQ